MGSARSRATGLYGNCIVLNKDGRRIFRTNKKTLKWYLQHALAVYLNDDTIQLTFDAKGDGYSDDSFYMQERENRCVVCGISSELCRSYLVPHGLRTWFPSELKDHTHFDITQMCLGCHNKWSKSRDALFRQLCMLHEVGVQGVWANHPMHILRLKARAAARTLVKNFDSGKIPGDRIALLRLMVATAHPGVDVCRPSALRAIAEADVPKPLVTSPGELLVEEFDGNKEVITKLLIWPFRNEFLASMKPKYMPAGWEPFRTER